MKATPDGWVDQHRKRESAPAIFASTRESKNCWPGLWLSKVMCWNSLYFQLCFQDSAHPFDKRPPSGSQWVLFIFACNCWAFSRSGTLVQTCKSPKTSANEYFWDKEFQQKKRWTCIKNYHANNALLGKSKYIPLLCKKVENLNRN